MNVTKIGIVTISDRASQGIYEDVSGKEIIKFLQNNISSEWVESYQIIPDEQEQIEQKLKELSDKEECCMILTTGGTGPTVRDVTPEATMNVCHKLLPGFGELMRQKSLQYVTTAILSRQTAGIRNKTLIVNLPGKPNSIKECLQEVFPAIPYCLELIGDQHIKIM